MRMETTFVWRISSFKSIFRLLPIRSSKSRSRKLPIKSKSLPLPKHINPFRFPFCKKMKTTIRRYKNTNADKRREKCLAMNPVSLRSIRVSHTFETTFAFQLGVTAFRDRGRGGHE